MPDAPLVIDMQAWPHGRDPDGPLVLVEPLYGGVAVAAALDAGWGEVEVAAEEPGEAPIPLVSYEQRPPGERPSDRCRVRSSDLHEHLRGTHAGGPSILLGSVVNARPLASALARATASASRVCFVPARSGDDALAVDATWACGVLIRVLLEELERDSELTDGAGIAVMLAQGAEDPAAQLSAGVRWRRHLERGGHADDLRVASAVDTVGVVPEVSHDGDSIIARPWLPTA